VFTTGGGLCGRPPPGICSSGQDAGPVPSAQAQTRHHPLPTVIRSGRPLVAVRLPLLYPMNANPHQELLKAVGGWR
jgi:hypothetical protein